MRLSLQSQILEYVVVIRCQGRIVAGEEVGILQSEIDKAVHMKKRIVLHLAGVDYIDSAGLGAVVRLFTVLRADGGGLKLCQVSPSVLKVLHATNLHTVLPAYESEKEAVDAFFLRRDVPEKESRAQRTPIVCIDSSADLLAYLNALLTRDGYEVFSTRHMNDARTLVNVIRPRVVIYGPNSQTNKAAIERIGQTVPDAHILFLPTDFSTAEASEAGTELISRVRSALATSQARRQSN
jgi:anti-sigma B factor antagonist